MISVTWMKCGSDGHWCDLEMLDLKTVTAKIGVDVIWREGNPSRVVRIGQGHIASRLVAHRQDPAILAYRKYGKLRVTWAAVPAHQLDGVERRPLWVSIPSCRRPDGRPFHSETGDKLFTDQLTVSGYLSERALILLRNLPALQTAA